MIRLPGMLMIGAAGRNTGKTELACSVIRRFRAGRAITGVKVTTVRVKDGTCPRGGKGCGVCSSLEGEFCITEETGEAAEKDTARLLAAGAERVYWLRVMRSGLEEGLRELLRLVGPGAVTVCESNSLRRVVEPGLFFITREEGSDEFKDSASEVLDRADRVVASDGQRFDLALEDMSLAGGEWALRADAAAVIMAGGSSTRMGADKAMLPVAGRPMIEVIRDRLRPHFKEILVSACEPEKYGFLGERIVPDDEPGQGPLMGIASALPACEHELAFVVACDMPEIDTALMKRLLRSARGYDGAVPVNGDGRLEPLFAVYSKRAAVAAREALAAGESRVRAAFDRCRIRFLELGDHETLENLNTAEEYERFRELYDDTV